jgi:hypothetical protein
MEETCIYYTSLHTPPISRHPDIVPCFIFGLLIVKLHISYSWKEEGSTNSPFKCFVIGMVIFLSIHEIFSMYEQIMAQ